MKSHDTRILAVQNGDVCGTGRRLAIVFCYESLAGTVGRLRSLTLVKGEIVLVHIHQDGEHLLPVGFCLFLLSLCLGFSLFLSLLLGLLLGSGVGIILTTALVSVLPAPLRLVAILLCNPLHVLG